MHSSPLELIARLGYSESSGFPKATMLEIIARKDEIIPHLIAVLESAHADPTEYLDDLRGMLPNYAAYLLAQFRETRAYRPLLALLNLEDDLTEEFFGDSVTEDMHNVLACVFDGDETPLRALIENPAADGYARGCAGLQTYLSLMKLGRIAAADVELYFHELFDHKLEREPSHVWDNLSSTSADLGFAALLPHIRKAFEDGLCDPNYDSLEHIEKRITSGGDARWMRDCEPIDDVVAMMETWACFNCTPARRPPPPDIPFLELLSQPREFSPRPVIPPPANYPRVGRNDLCPCDSGRKFKKCCGGV